MQASCEIDDEYLRLATNASRIRQRSKCGAIDGAFLGIAPSRCVYVFAFSSYRDLNHIIDKSLAISERGDASVEDGEMKEELEGGGEEDGDEGEVNQ
jgi:hypothetical protein